MEIRYFTQMSSPKTPRKTFVKAWVLEQFFTMSAQCSRHKKRPLPRNGEAARPNLTPNTFDWPTFTFHSLKRHLKDTHKSLHSMAIVRSSRKFKRMFHGRLIIKYGLITRVPRDEKFTSAVKCSASSTKRDLYETIYEPFTDFFAS